MFRASRSFEPKDCFIRQIPVSLITRQYDKNIISIQKSKVGKQTDLYKYIFISTGKTRYDIPVLSRSCNIIVYTYLLFYVHLYRQCHPTTPSGSKASTFSMLILL